VATPNRGILSCKRPRNIKHVPEFHPYADMVPNAPAAIIVCGDSNSGPWLRLLGPGLCRCYGKPAAAVHAAGLAEVWLGMYPLKERIEGAGKLFNLPANIIPFAIVPIGYSDEEKEPKDRFDPGKITTTMVKYFLSYHFTSLKYRVKVKVETEPAPVPEKEVLVELFKKYGEWLFPV